MADLPKQEQAIQAMAQRRIDRSTKEYAGRNVDTRARDVAQFLNRGSQGGVDLADVVDAPGFSNYDVVREMVGGSAIDPFSVQPEQIRAAVAGLGAEGKTAVARGMALSEGPGIMERLKGFQRQITGALAEDSRRGEAARIGVVTAATGGTVMGLTAAGQGLMALTQYLQQGMQSEQEREQPLA